LSQLHFTKNVNLPTAQRIRRTDDHEKRIGDQNLPATSHCPQDIKVNRYPAAG